jgi:two-component SAPR family response regulator
MVECLILNTDRTLLLTAFDEYAVKKNMLFDYLLKPIEEKRPERR